MITRPQIQALRYVHNTQGNATLAHFLEDHDPIGQTLWDALLAAGLVHINDTGHIALTEAGKPLATSIPLST